MRAYIGIDVSCAKKKRCPISICIKKDGRLVPLFLANRIPKPPMGFGNAKTLEDESNIAYSDTVKDYIVDVCNEYNLTPIRIAIDAPLVPKQNGLKRRVAEQALDARKISCYATPSQSEFNTIINKGRMHLKTGGEVTRLYNSHQIFMLAGFAIYQALKGLAECIEVFPHATAKILGTASKHKTMGNQAYIQLRAMSQYTGWPATEKEWDKVKDICSGDLHDKVDAYGAAWIASLDDNQREVLGEVSSNDAIFLPCLETLEKFKLPPVADTKLGTQEKPKTEPISEPVFVNKDFSQNDESSYSKNCPACRQFVFKRWPWGWDAHAAHKCLGLTSDDPIARKHEYKRKYLQKASD